MRRERDDRLRYREESGDDARSPLSDKRRHGRTEDRSRDYERGRERRRDRSDDSLRSDRSRDSFRGRDRRRRDDSPDYRREIRDRDRGRDRYDGDWARSREYGDRDRGRGREVDRRRGHRPDPSRDSRRDPPREATGPRDSRGPKPRREEKKTYRYDSPPADYDFNMKSKAPEYADMSVLKTILPSLYNNTPEEILEKVNAYKTNSRSMMAKMECKLYVGNIPQGITDRQVTSTAPRRHQQRPRPTQN